MSYLLDGERKAYPSWRNYFDIVIVGGAKPAFFNELRPFVQIDPVSGEAISTNGEIRAPVARQGLPGRQRRRLRADDRHQGRAGPLHRRPHLRRHPAAAQAAHVAHRDGAAGARARDLGRRAARGPDPAISTCSIAATATSSRRSITRRLRLKKIQRLLDEDATSRGRSAPGSRRSAAWLARSVDSLRDRAAADGRPRSIRSRRASIARTTRTGAAACARATRTRGSASRSTTTPTSTRRGSRTSGRTRRCATSARRAGRCRTRSDRGQRCRFPGGVTPSQRASIGATWIISSWPVGAVAGTCGVRPGGSTISGTSWS